MEECDSLQGFQLLVDTEDAFGGLGSCIVQELVEEYGQKGIFSITPSPNTRPLDKVVHVMWVCMYVPYISELTLGTNRSLVSVTSLVISSDNVNRGLVLFLLLCLIYKPGHN